MNERGYFAELTSAFGQAWNRFWFLPSDPAPLAAIRVLAGGVALYWLASFLPDLSLYFAADGLTPPELVASLNDDRLLPSYLNYLQTPSELLAAHVVGMAIVAALTAGIATRVSSVLSFIVVLSYVNRAPMLSTQTESLLAMVLLYLCIGPAGARWSIDRWRAARRGQPPITESYTATIALRLIQVHFALLMAIMGLSKLWADYWWSGVAMWLLIARTDSRLVDFSGLPLPLINLWTHVHVLFELTFPILVWHRLARPILLWWGAVMWTLLALVTGNVPFSLMLIVASLSYVPGSTIVRWLPERRQRASAPQAALASR